MKRHYTLATLGLCIALLASMAGFNAWVDPLQYYRLARNYPPAWSTNARYQIPGIARNVDFEIAVIGNSHAQNFFPEDISRVLGRPAMNLSIQGSTIREQALVMDLVVQRDSLRRVLWVIDHGAFTRHDAVVEDLGPFPWHLYHGGLEAASHYLLGIDTFVASVSALRVEASPTLAEYLRRYADATHTAERVHADWNALLARWTPTLKARWTAYAPNWPSVRDVAERRVIEVIRNHPRIEFDLVLAPITWVSYGSDALVHDQQLAQRLLLAEYLVEAIAGLPNARVHDFRMLAAAGDLARFKDLQHFDPRVNIEILDAIAAGTPHPVDTGKLVDLIVGEFERRCAHGSDDNARFCEPQVRCAIDRLAAWRRRGAPADQLLEPAAPLCSETAQPAAALP
jgi:hypothetical protein